MRTPIRFTIACVLVALATPSFALADDDESGLPLPKTHSTPAVLAPVKTKFDPKVDGMPFGNNGDYTSEAGNCFGMSLLAVDAYKRRMAGVAVPARKIVQDAKDADLPLAAAAAVLQDRADLLDGDDHDNPKVPLGSTKELTAALERIRKTGVPEVMGIYTGPGKNDPSHAIVLHGYEDGALKIYDPNYPGETISWPFDPKKGLGKHPKASDDPDLYGKLKLVSSTPIEKYVVTPEIDWVRDSCSVLADRCLAHFPRLDVRVEEAPASKKGPRVAITGRLTGGLAKNSAGDTKAVRPSRVWIAVDGKPVGSGTIDKDGTYRVVVPADVARGTLRVVATTKDGALGAFVEKPEAVGLIERLGTGR